MNQLLVQARDRTGNVFARVHAIDSGDAIRVASRWIAWAPGLVVEIVSAPASPPLPRTGIPVAADVVPRRPMPAVGADTPQDDESWPCAECGAGNLDMLADSCRLCGGDKPA